MNDNKRPEADNGDERMNAEASEHPSRRQGTKEKSKQKLYPKEDKTKTAREEHTNGSTPRSRL